MSDNNTVELDVGSAVETEVEILSSPLAGEAEERTAEDQFSKAETSTQKRIDRLTKKMREAERREHEALKYAQAVQGESNNVCLT